MSSEEMNKAHDQPAETAAVLSRADELEQKVEDALTRLENLRTQRDDTSARATHEAELPQVPEVIAARIGFAVQLAERAMLNAASRVRQIYDEQLALFNAFLHGGKGREVVAEVSIRRKVVRQERTAEVELPVRDAHPVSNVMWVGVVTFEERDWIVKGFSKSKDVPPRSWSAVTDEILSILSMEDFGVKLEDLRSVVSEGSEGKPS